MRCNENGGSVYTIMYTPLRCQGVVPAGLTSKFMEMGTLAVCLALLESVVDSSSTSAVSSLWRWPCMLRSLQRTQSREDDMAENMITVIPLILTQYTSVNSPHPHTLHFLTPTPSSHYTSSHPPHPHTLHFLNSPPHNGILSSFVLGLPSESDDLNATCVWGNGNTDLHLLSCQRSLEQ